MADPNTTKTDVEKNFGMDGYAVETKENGEKHHTVFSSEKGSARFSWNTDPNGNVTQVHETIQK